MDIANSYPKYQHRQFHWVEPLNEKASEEHDVIKQKIEKRQYSSTEDFYFALRPLLKPKEKGKALRDAKHRNCPSKLSARAIR